MNNSSLTIVSVLVLTNFLQGCALLKGLGHNDDDAHSRRETSLSTANTSKVDPDQKRLYKNVQRTTKDDFVDQSETEGSLWAGNGQTNYYFTKNKVRNPGDIVTLVIENDLYKDMGAEIRRTLSKKEKEIEIQTTREYYRAKFEAEIEKNKEAKETKDGTTPETNTPAKQEKERSGGIKMAPEIQSPKNAEDAEKVLSNISLKDVDLFPVLEFKPGDKMMGEILERYPNGNCKVRTFKRIPYGRGAQRVVSIVGVVRPQDIDDDSDELKSGKLYEYRVEVSR